MTSHQRNMAPMQASARCGATTRAGHACRSPQVAGSSRCRMHGGKGSGAPLGNRNAVKHGAFDKEMRERNARVRALRRELRALEKRLGERD